VLFRSRYYRELTEAEFEAN